jgi:endonuclease/exonuclease/phosphatase family metal-dependent hydrolase
MKKYPLYLLAGTTWLAGAFLNVTVTAGTEVGHPVGVIARKPINLRVITYNVHHCNPPSKPNIIDMAAVAQAIRAQNPDVVALQEIDVNTKRSGAFNQAEELARQLNMQFFFGKAIDHEGGDYGVAILSKYPLSETTVHRLPTKPATKGEPRVLATAKITLPNGTALRFGSTHLDAQRDSVNRQLQVAEINRIASAEKLPFIIAGDFNAPPSTAVIKQLDQHFTRTCQPCDPTIPVNNPTKAIDFVAYAPATKFKVNKNQVIPERYASDHLPVLAEITLRAK